MKINIETIPHAAHRYATFGDWWRDADGTMQIRVSEMADVRDAALGAVHELIEMLVCEQYGVTERIVTDWDRAHPDVAEPGELRYAPYHHQHVFAENIERQLALALRREWSDYVAAFDKLFEEE